MPLSKDQLPKGFKGVMPKATTPNTRVVGAPVGKNRYEFNCYMCLQGVFVRTFRTQSALLNHMRNYHRIKVDGKV